jgi:hypothetical protein
MFMPQFPAQPKPSPAPKPSIPPTVKKSIPDNPLTGNKLRYWDHRGTQAMKAFLDVLSRTDEQAKRAAFYGTESSKGLRDVIKEVTDKTNHADVEELDGWIAYALKGRSKQEIESIVRSVTAGFGAKGDIYTNVRARLVHRAELLLKTMRDLEARDERGVEHTKRVIKALGNGSTAELKNAFFDPGYGEASYGKNPGLYEFIKKIVPNGDEASERACFDKWLGEALKGRLLLELIPLWNTIKTNMENPVCLRNGVFQTFEQVLRQHIDERKKLDDFMQAITANGDIGSAADKFELTIRAFAGKDPQLSQARMSALIADYLGRRPNDVAKLKDKWAELPDCPSVTALRGCLGLSDSMAVENLLLELAKWNEPKAKCPDCASFSCSRVISCGLAGRRRSGRRSTRPWTSSHRNRRSPSLQVTSGLSLTVRKFIPCSVTRSAQRLHGWRRSISSVNVWRITLPRSELSRRWRMSNAHQSI